MSVADLLIPDTVKNQAIQILADIENAHGILEMSQLAGFAEGFTCALGCVSALPPAELTALEMIFTAAVSRRMTVLRE